MSESIQNLSVGFNVCFAIIFLLVGVFLITRAICAERDKQNKEIITATLYQSQPVTVQKKTSYINTYQAEINGKQILLKDKWPTEMPIADGAKKDFYIDRYNLNNYVVANGESQYLRMGIVFLMIVAIMLLFTLF